MTKVAKIKLNMSEKGMLKSMDRLSLQIAKIATMTDRTMFARTKANTFMDGTADKKNDMFAFATPPIAVINSINLKCPLACNSIIKYCIKAVKMIEKAP